MVLDNLIKRGGASDAEKEVVDVTQKVDKSSALRDQVREIIRQEIRKEGPAYIRSLMKEYDMEADVQNLQNLSSQEDKEDQKKVLDAE